MVKEELVKLLSANVRLARRRWQGFCNPRTLQALRAYTEQFNLSISAGDLTLLDGAWYVTHSGLLRLARRERCTGIHVEPVIDFSDVSISRFAFKATVYKSRTSPGFVGFGDADPSNVSSIVHGAEMRVAETRAVNRALRKAYGIGICSVEEMGTIPTPVEQLRPQNRNGNGNGGPKVRDRLCQLIRQHKLDAQLVKAYAVDYCGTKTLREATREQVENFVRELGVWAEKDRNALLCQLNSYVQPKPEVVA